ncbi:MAG: type I glyceraldehyde-3-phosphate dehydrogenase [Candidatus Roizmanbacteria bacterium]|nr:type I glyceraldehyde-3-phosphate dehydrogenase [Candidatus Roizmanbacteria bacterium]
MSKIKVGLNGFGRIGRAVTRIAEGDDSFEIVHINTRKTPNKTLAYLLKYDSVYRTFNKSVKATEDGIEIDGRTITTSLRADPAEIPWGGAEVQVVIDATGAFVTKSDLSKHLRDTVKKVILTAPAKDDDTFHVVLGVNEIDQSQQVISNASCTTNCAAPLISVLHNNFKIIRGYLTTAHAYTATQSLLDDAAKSPDRGRAAALNIIPSTTGAAKAVGQVIPELKGKMNGIALRVPVPTGSFVDITAVVEKETTPEEINSLFKKESEGALKGILGYAEDIIVSSDIIGSTYSSIFDPNYTDVIDGTFVKVYGWYDNEWGYSSRVVDLVKKLSL